MPRRSSRSDGSPQLAEAFAAALVLGYLAIQYISSCVEVALVCVSGLTICAAILLLFFRKHFRRRHVSPTSAVEFDTRSATRGGGWSSEPKSARELVERLRRVDWFQFEQIVAIAYRKTGFQVERRGGARPDGGIDLLITAADGARTGIQCKQWKTWNIGVKSIREFVVALKIAGLERGIFITLRGSTGEALRTAEACGIGLVNEEGLARLLESADALDDPGILELLNGAKKLCPPANETAVTTVPKNAL